MRQPFWFRSVNNPGTGSSWIAPLGGPSFQSTALYRSSCPVAAPGTFGNLVVTVLTAPGAGKSFTYTLMINGVASTLTCSISNTATTARDITHTPAVIAGDTIAIEVVGSGTPTLSNVQFALEFVGTNTGESVYGFGPVGEVVATTRTNTLLFPQISTNWQESNARSISAIDGNITKLYTTIDIVVAAASSWTFALLKNNVVQDGTAGTPDTRIVYTTGQTGQKNASFTLAVVAGDRLAVRATISSTPGSMRPLIGVNFVATTDGESSVGCAFSDSTDAAATEFHRPTNEESAAWSTTEANHVAKGGVTNFILDRFRTILNLAPGNSGASYTFTLRKNLLSTTLVSAIVDPATTGSDTTHRTTIRDGDSIAIQCAPAGTPQTRSGGWAFRAAAGTALDFNQDMNTRIRNYLQDFYGIAIDAPDLETMVTRYLATLSGDYNARMQALITSASTF